MWPFPASVVRPPPICLSPPSEDLYPLPLLPEPLCVEPLGPPLIPPLRLMIILGMVLGGARFLPL